MRLSWVAYLGFFVCGIIMLTKVCSVCGVEKSVGEYFKHGTGKHGVRGDCKACRKQYYAQLYEDNKDAIDASRVAYRKANKEVMASQRNAYRKANPHIINAINAKRKATKLQATPSWANKEHIDSVYLLASINRKAGYDVQVDHIVPLRSDMVCGLHCESNLQLLLGSDNLFKGNRHWPDQW